MRIAVGVIGGVGAVIGILRGLLVVVPYGTVSFQMGDFFGLVQGVFGLMYLSTLGTELVALLLAIAGMVGVGLMFARGGRAGVYLMLIAGIGIVVVLLAQGVLFNLAIPAPVRPPYTLPSPTFLVFALSPGVLLLISGVLALVATRIGARD